MGRFLWWIVYFIRFKLLTAAVGTVCALICSAFKKKIWWLYFTAEGAACVAGVIMGVKTFHNTHFFDAVIDIILIIVFDFISWIFLPTTEDKDIDGSESESEG